MILREAIETLLQKKNLTESQCHQVVEEIIESAVPEQTSAFLALLRAKGETTSELLGVVKATRAHMIAVSAGEGLIDLVGTGGDGSHSVNISTGAAILAAAAGCKVAKHGNRASSSKCGSADVLEALGISMERDPVKDLEAFGICFLYAPRYHPAAKKVAPIRKALGVRTVFNLIGPFLNPTSPERLLLGVPREELLPLFAEAVSELGVKRALIVYGNGMDELNPIGSCHVIEVREEKKERSTIDPEALGLKRCSAKDLEGGSRDENKAILEKVLGGEEGAVADTLILNAGAALYLSEISPTIQEGVKRARKTLKEGKGKALLDQWRKG